MIGKFNFFFYTDNWKTADWYQLYLKHFSEILINKANTVKYSEK